MDSSVGLVSQTNLDVRWKLSYPCGKRGRRNKICATTLPGKVSQIVACVRRMCRMLFAHLLTNYHELAAALVRAVKKKKKRRRYRSEATFEQYCSTAIRGWQWLRITQCQTLSQHNYMMVFVFFSPPTVIFLFIGVELDRCWLGACTHHPYPK